MNAPNTAQIPATSFYAKLLNRKSELEERYRALTPNSAKLFKEAQDVLPGGSTRDSLMRRPYPSFIERGEGSHLFDADGRRLIDFWFNATSLPLGYCHPAVTEVVKRQVDRGTAFFAPGRGEIELARELLRRLPSAELVRFTNSGSEAVMLALRLARGATGRNIVGKFEGSYHGSYDDVSWSVGPPAGSVGDAKRPNAVPESAGLPSSLGRALVLPFNDLAATTALVEQHATGIAALIVEPVANRMGFVLPSKEFVQGLRALCDSHGIVMIFDEVISFRVGYGGAQNALGVHPDVTTLGKVIGGGFPVGAVVGKADVLLQSSPARQGNRVTHAGTFNGNPVTMAAGLATLQQLSPATFEQMNSQAERLRSGLTKAVEGLPLQISGTGSLFKINASDRPIVDYRGTMNANLLWEEVLAMALLTDGFFLTPRVQGCISAVTTSAEVDALIAKVSALIQ